MITLEICQKQPFDIVGMSSRGTLGLCCVHIAQLMTHPAVYALPFTLQLCYKPLGILQRVTKSQKVHISSHDLLQKLHNIDFTWHRSGDFLKEEVEKQEFPAFPMKAVENNQKLLPILNEDQGRSWASHTKIHCGHSCCNEKFQILLTFDLHRLANDANENYNYIACQFII